MFDHSKRYQFRLISLLLGLDIIRTPRPTSSIIVHPPLSSCQVLNVPHPRTSNGVWTEKSIDSAGRSGGDIPDYCGGCGYLLLVSVYPSGFACHQCAFFLSLCFLSALFLSIWWHLFHPSALFILWVDFVFDTKRRLLSSVLLSKTIQGGNVLSSCGQYHTRLNECSPHNNIFHSALRGI